MAQLTWRNVDAPNFSGVTDALRLSGQALASGLAAGRDAIGDFQKGQTAAESARVIAATADVTDPTKLKEILGGFDPRYVSSDAMKVALDRPQDLARLDQIKASTASTVQTTDHNRQYNPLLIAGKTIDNASSGVKLQKDAFDLDVSKKQHEATPAYTAELGLYHQLKASTDPADQARAATMIPSLTAKGASAGVKDITSVLAKGDVAGAAALKYKSDYLTYDATQKAANLTASAKGLGQSTLDALGSPVGATRSIQEDPNIPAELKAATLKFIGEAAGSYTTPSQGEILSATAGQAAAQGQPVAIPTEPRAKLDFFTSAAKAAGLEVTSGFRDPDDPLSKANPNSAHTQSRAWDLRARTPEQGDTVMAKQREIFTKMGMQEGRDYKILDEVRNPAKHATGPHIHVKLTAEGRARQETADAGRGGDRARQIINQAVTQAAPTTFAPPQEQPAQAPVEAGVDLRTPQGLATNEQALNSLLNSVKTQSTMDAAMDPTAAITEAFAKPKDSKSTALEVATQLHKNSGGEKSNGGLFDRDELTVRNINSAVQAVIRDYKVSPDLAGVLVASAIQTTEAFLPLVGNGGRRFDVNQVKTYVDRYVTKDGKPKTELLNIQTQKVAIAKQADEAQGLLQKAKEEWLGAEGAAQRGNTRVNVEAARERYAKAQRAADALARRLASNPNVLGNSAANTGR